MKINVYVEYCRRDLTFTVQVRAIHEGQTSTSEHKFSLHGDLFSLEPGGDIRIDDMNQFNFLVKSLKRDVLNEMAKNLTHTLLIENTRH
jgi:hypothetical protein